MLSLHHWGQRSQVGGLPAISCPRTHVFGLLECLKILTQLMTFEKVVISHKNLIFSFFWKKKEFPATLSLRVLIATTAGAVCGLRSVHPLQPPLSVFTPPSLHPNSAYSISCLSHGSLSCGPSSKPALYTPVWASLRSPPPRSQLPHM